ncbi:YjzC family protein [Nannocystis pusilla]|uniref:YjzC family protein n=1 Tax=Nannocystis pusilla TaxID=889268 RepID=UPI003BF04CBE
MASVGDRFKTGETCAASGVYGFDGYTNGASVPPPTQEERVISLQRGEAFPPIRSSNRGAYWRLHRLH